MGQQADRPVMESGNSQFKKKWEWPYKLSGIVVRAES